MAWISDYKLHNIFIVMSLLNVDVIMHILISEAIKFPASSSGESQIFTDCT